MAKESSKSSNPFFRRENTRQAGMTKSAPASPAAPGSATATATRPAPAKLTHEMIADRAKAIWKAKGCPSGLDRENWLEAEAQLRKELNIR